MMALVLWSDNLGINMVFFFFCGVDVDDVVDGAKLEKIGN
jgi:hypothetical protein